MLYCIVLYLTQCVLQRAAKTAIVLSRHFISDAWWDAYEVPLLTADDVAGMAGDMLLILLHDCCVPTSLLDVPRVDPRTDDWWTILLGHLCKTGQLLKMSSGKVLIPINKLIANGFNRTCFCD